MTSFFSKRAVRPEEPEDTGELNIVPYLDIMMNLIMFMLLSMTGLVSLGVLAVTVPKYVPPMSKVDGAQERPRESALLLSVLVSEKGFFIAGTGGVLGSSREAVGGGGAPTIPKKESGEYDYAALSAKMTEIKRAFPEESKVILSADPTSPYDVLVHTMDACRENPAQLVDGRPELLFPDVLLALP